MKLTEQTRHDAFTANPRTGELAGYALLFCFISSAMQDCPRVNLIGFIWPVIGLAWVFARLLWEARKETSTVTEMFVTMCEVTGIFNRVFTWPIDMYHRILTDGPYSTLRRELQLQVYLYGPDYNEWANDASAGNYQAWHREVADQLMECRMEEIHDEADELQELPSLVVRGVGTQTAYACGATVLIVNASGQCEARGQTSINSSGWITVLGSPTSSTHTPQVSVTDFRLRTTLEGGVLNDGASIFVDVDLLEATGGSPNWLKMAQMNFALDDSSALHVGRIPKSAIFNFGDPYDQRTVSYPRAPYNFFACGLQYEWRSPRLHLVADITAGSGFDFVDRDQFESADGSLRFDGDITPSVNLGIAAQIANHSQIMSLDARLKPVSTITINAMVYGSPQHRMHGFSITTVVQPIDSVPGFDIHSMLDRVGGPGGSSRSFEWSVGVGVRTANSNWSFTVDYEADTSRDRPSGPRLRLQHRFK